MTFVHKPVICYFRNISGPNLLRSCRVFRSTGVRRRIYGRNLLRNYILLGVGTHGLRAIKSSLCDSVTPIEALAALATIPCCA